MSRPLAGPHPSASLALASPVTQAPIPTRPLQPALAPSAIDHGLTGTRSGSVAKVASVGLPAMEKGLVIPNKPVAPISLNRDYFPGLP